MEGTASIRGPPAARFSSDFPHLLRIWLCLPSSPAATHTHTCIHVAHGRGPSCWEPWRSQAASTLFCFGLKAPGLREAFRSERTTSSSSPVPGSCSGEAALGPEPARSLSATAGRAREAMAAWLSATSLRSSRTLIPRGIEGSWRGRPCWLDRTSPAPGLDTE